MGDEGLSSALHELARKGNLHSHQADILLSRSLNGEHVFILGPHKAGKIKLAQALACDIGKRARLWPVENASLREAILSGLKCAKAAGADYVLLIDILPADLFWLMAHDPSVCIIASLAVANPTALWFSASELQLNFKQNILQKSVYQVGFDALGNAQLINDLPQMKIATKSLVAEQLGGTPFAFPQNWARETVKHDPGWELDGENRENSQQGPLLRGEKTYE